MERPVLALAVSPAIEQFRTFGALLQSVTQFETMVATNASELILNRMNQWMAFDDHIAGRIAFGSDGNVFVHSY